jgi:predicted metalloenzyme YecM
MKRQDLMKYKQKGKKFPATLHIDATKRTINFSSLKQEKEKELKQEKYKGEKQKVC